MTEHANARPAPRAKVDDSFALAMVDLLRRNDVSARARLLEHPALGAILRHQRMTGNRRVEPSGLLDEIVETARRAGPATAVLGAWDGRHGDLLAFVTEAARLLPASWEFAGTVFLVMGYDIGVAAPPDIVLNVAHEHFCTHPEELGFYATHEAHHVGFLSLRPLPDLEELTNPARLLEIIRYMTQLEGMGVHAAYRSRERSGNLASDDDYAIYQDPELRRQVVGRYAELTAGIASRSTIPDREVGLILNRMSSGERLWYRFGALVAWELERSRGRMALIDSISNPEEYLVVADELLIAAGSE